MWTRPFGLRLRGTATTTSLLPLLGVAGTVRERYLLSTELYVYVSPLHDATFLLTGSRPCPLMQALCCCGQGSRLVLGVALPRSLPVPLLGVAAVQQVSLPCRTVLAVSGRHLRARYAV